MLGKPVRRWGVKSKRQLPLLMVWDEFRYKGQVVHASVVFSSRDLRQAWFWRDLANRARRLLGRPPVHYGR